ncbi:MAG: radical SAM family heme chaperone HemW [Deltaproteobacteria bacterium]|nr:radical SAM family heme chaperone HemW [Deltaproteobacteria bacterium]
MTPFSLYLHVPYCDSKCPYCDFNSYAVKRWPERDYCAALVAELRHAAAEPAWRDGTVQTVFFGGGTPSLFAPESIAAVLDAVRSLWKLAGPDVEITLEANPGTVDRARLRGFRGAGINRISFGVQSFHPAHLARLGRIHSAAQAIDAIGAAREAGFANLNLDLIFAVPGQTLEEWQADIETAVSLGPDHVSAYSLTFEEGTAFHAQRRGGRLLPVAEEIEVAMFTHTRTALAAHGYAAYEISNFAKPGRACAHNLNYWHAGAYLGVGAGAHSFASHPAPGRRWGNEKLPARYIERARRDGSARAGDEVLSDAQARGEFVFLGLRCSDGFAAAAFARRFGSEFAQAFPHAEAFVRDGMLECAGGRWRLTERGLLFADSVFATFL